MKLSHCGCAPRREFEETTHSNWGQRIVIGCRLAGSFGVLVQSELRNCSVSGAGGSGGWGVGAEQFLGKLAEEWTPGGAAAAMTRELREAMRRLGSVGSLATRGDAGRRGSAALRSGFRWGAFRARAGTRAHPEQPRVPVERATTAA